MPEAVNTFVQTHDLNALRQVQNNLLLSYRQDFSKYGPDLEIPKAYQVWVSVVQQLAKENRKFTYSEIKKGARAKEYETSIKWLTDTGLLHQVHRIEKPGIPLAAYRDPRPSNCILSILGCWGPWLDCSPPPYWMEVFSLWNSREL